MDRNYAQYLLDKVRTDYNQIAKEFSSTRQTAWPEIRSLFNDFVKDGNKILDLGCGNGRYVDFLQEKQIEYFGVDNSEGLIAIAKQRYSQQNFQVADGLNLPFVEDFFDKIYCIAVLHHIPSKEQRLKFLKEVKRVLKPNGILVLTVWKFRWLKEISLLLRYTILKLLGKNKMDFGDIIEPWGKQLGRYYHIFSQNDLRKLCKEVGFEIMKIGIVSNQGGNRNNIYLVAKNIVKK